MTIYQASKKNSTGHILNKNLKVQKVFLTLLGSQLSRMSCPNVSRSLVTGVTTGNSPLPPGHIEETQRWETDIVSGVQLNGHTQTSAPGV